jgi:hypothetical protein
VAPCQKRRIAWRDRQRGEASGVGPRKAGRDARQGSLTRVRYIAQHNCAQFVRLVSDRAIVAYSHGARAAAGKSFHRHFQQRAPAELHQSFIASEPARSAAGKNKTSKCR